VKIKLTERFLSYLSGSQLMQTPDNLEAHGYGVAGQQVIEKIHAAPRRKDRSRTIEVDVDQVEVLRDYAETLNVIGGDTSYDADGRADLACARALLRHLNAGSRTER
jgi:hypothetical protein